MILLAAVMGSRIGFAGMVKPLMILVISSNMACWLLMSVLRNFSFVDIGMSIVSHVIPHIPVFICRIALTLFMLIDVNVGAGFEFRMHGQVLSTPVAVTAPYVKRNFSYSSCNIVTAGRERAIRRLSSIISTVVIRTHVSLSMGVWGFCILRWCVSISADVCKLCHCSK
jgi:hypothetical protein